VRLSALIVAGAPFVVLVACGGSSRTVTGGRGGAAGRMAGAGGAPHGGSGGTKGGRAGTSGTGALAGRDGGAGMAASGGQCLDEIPRWSFGCDAQLSLTSTCTFAETCRVLRCGEPSSEFDENACERVTCRSSAECAANERCMAAPLLGDFSCRPSYFEGCIVSDCGECTCNSDPDCFGTSFCLPASEHSPEDDCPLGPVLDCAMYEHEQMMLGNYLDPDPAAPGDTQEALRACAAKLEPLLEKCFGVGAGGGGTAGGPEGGQGGGGNGAQGGR
jgi:hypothetical protein